MRIPRYVFTILASFWAYLLNLAGQSWKPVMQNISHKINWIHTFSQTWFWVRPQLLQEFLLYRARKFKSLKKLLVNEQDTVVLCSNSSRIRSGGQGSKPHCQPFDNWKKERKGTSVVTEDDDILGMSRNLDP